MNAPFPPPTKTTLARLPTSSLADVLAILVQSELPPTRRRDYQSALHTVSRILGEPLSAIPADVGALRPKLASVQAAGAGLSQKTWANVRSNLLAAIRVTGLAPVLKTARLAYSPAWRVLLPPGLDEGIRFGLTRFARFCSAIRIEPELVNDEVVSAFADALRTSSLARSPNSAERSVCTLWNRLVDRNPGCGLSPVRVPSFRKPSEVPWDRLPESFLVEVDQHLAWAEGADVFAADARAKKLSPQSIKNRKALVRSAVGALVVMGYQPEQITSLSVLTAPAAFELILRRRYALAQGRPNSQNKGIATELITIAKEWVKAPREQLEHLKRLRGKLPQLEPGLRPKNSALLRAFDDPELVGRFLELPWKLWRRALRRPSSVRQLADGQAAIAIALLTYAPLRIANAGALAFGTTLFLPKTDREETLIELPAHLTKTRQPYSITLPPAMTAMLRLYRDRMLEPLLKARPVHLFDNGTGTPKDRRTISWLIQRTTARHLGITISAHQFRHIAAKLMLDDEADYETVKQLLGHQNLKTTVNHYAGLDTRRAGRRHAALVERAMAERRGASVPHKGTRKRRKP
jgi:integrase